MRRSFFIFLLFTLFTAAVSSSLAENKEIVITFTGDCTLGCDKKMIDSPNSFLRYIENNGYGYPFEKARGLFEEDDLTVINLEGVFSDVPRGMVDKTYNFRAPKEYVNILTCSSVEAVSFGNNHSMDFGDFGCAETIDALDKAGVAWFGCNPPLNPNKTDFNSISSTWIYEKDGIRIGFVAAWISSYWAETSMHRAQVEELKNAGCNLIIACLHGGVEYDPIHDISQEKFARNYLQYGCDIVIGNHPHVLQGIEISDLGTIVYSLGNFCFGGNQVIKETDRSSARYSAVYRFNFSFAEDGTYLGHQMKIFPFCSAAEINEKSNYQPFPASGKDAEKIMKLIHTDTMPRKFLNVELTDGYALQPFVPAPSKE